MMGKSTAPEGKNEKQQSAEQKDLWITYG